MNLYNVTSELHSEISCSTSCEPFITEIEKEIGKPFVHKASLEDYCSDDSLIYVRTGGSEGIFKSVFCRDGRLDIPGSRPVRLLASAQSNSLAASMEILSFLRRNGLKGEILHGTPVEIVEALKSPTSENGESLVGSTDRFKGVLAGKRYGVIGRPSDWLISSDVDYAKAKEVLGCELVDIDINELVAGIRKGGYEAPAGLRSVNVPKFGKPISSGSFKTAVDVYGALKEIVAKYSLDGFTLRCFDLLTAVNNTGCLALAQFNSEGIIATCEGDVPTMLTMAVAKAVTGRSSFQVNLSRAEGSRLLFAHCTVPFDMVRDYCYDTHFESGIGVGIHGELEEGVPATILKIGADVEHCYMAGIRILKNQYEKNLCRTQIWVEGQGVKDYLLREPLGNHHVIVLGAPILQ